MLLKEQQKRLTRRMVRLDAVPGQHNHCRVSSQMQQHLWHTTLEGNNM